ncbi:MAG: rhodanese-like domain-containing protein [Cyclobacteriaceae bacterium]
MKATIIILTALTVLVSSCGPSSSTDERGLDPERFEQMLTESNDKVILDVRTPEEFADGHIPGALLINVNESDFKAKVSELDKSKTIFVYCAAGIRSEKASAVLKDSGFEKVYHLEDGLKAWNNAQKELTK